MTGGGIAPRGPPLFPLRFRRCRADNIPAVFPHSAADRRVPASDFSARLSSARHRRRANYDRRRPTATGRRTDGRTGRVRSAVPDKCAAFLIYGRRTAGVSKMALLCPTRGDDDARRDRRNRRERRKNKNKKKKPAAGRAAEFWRRRALVSAAGRCVMARENRIR